MDDEALNKGVKLLEKYSVDTTVLKQLADAGNEESIQALCYLGRDDPKLAYYYSPIKGISDSRSWGFAITEYEVSKSLLFFYSNYIRKEGAESWCEGAVARINYNGDLLIGQLKLDIWRKSCDLLFQNIPDDDRDTWAYFADTPEISVVDRPDMTWPNQPREYAQGKLTKC